MFNLNTIQQGITRSFGRGSLVLQKHSPEILLGAGLVGVAATVFMASKATLKVEGIMAETAETLAKIDEVHTASEQEGNTLSGTYSEEDAMKDKGIVYVQTGLKFAKLYGPAFGVGVLSIAAILASHGVMRNRQVALVAAYNLVAEGFKSYRDRVVEELGPDVDRNFHLGLREETIKEDAVGEDGKTVKTKKAITVHDPKFKSVYARFFDANSSQWTKDPTQNLFFLKARQNYFNDLLDVRGHVFLNEVYESLGFNHTSEGSIVGWIKNSETGDKFIDFDLENAFDGRMRDFVNGYEPVAFIDFNVDGIIFDKI